MAKRLLRLPAVIDRTGSNASDIYDGMKEGTFPRSVPIGQRTVGWVEDEIEAWIESRIAARGLQPQRKGGPGRGHTKPRYHLLSPEEMDDRASAQMAKGFEWLHQQRQQASQPPQDTTKPEN